MAHDETKPSETGAGVPAGRGRTPPLPDHIDVANARLPPTYEQAKASLLHCTSIDECQDWADKAEALAAYARMAEDDTLRKLAERIQARAVRRAGELVKWYEDRWRMVEDRTVAGAVPEPEAAPDAGLPNQEETAGAADMPNQVSEDTGESRGPLILNRLADMGRQPLAASQRVASASHLLGEVRRFAMFCRNYSAEAAAADVKSYDAPAVKQQVAVIEAWLGRFIVKLKD